MKIPVIETRRLIMREWRETDFEAYAAFRADATLCQHIGVLERAEAWRVMAYLAGHWSLLGFGNWSVTLKSGEPVGYCGLYFPKEWPEAEIGWGTYPSHGGKGYATEAAIASLDFAYRELGWKTAMSLIADTNAPSSAVARKLGAVPDYPFEYRGAPCTIYRHLNPQEFQSRFKGEITWH